MKKVLIFCLMILFLVSSLVLATDKKSKSSSKKPAQAKEVVLDTEGILDKIDAKKGEVYIKQNGKTVKFKATKEICDKYAKKKGKKGVIKYIKLPDGSMLIKDIIIK